MISNGALSFSVVEIKCPDLDDPKDGSVDVSGVLPGDKAKYRCDYGFRLDGEHTRTCQYNGVWTGEAPTCKRKNNPLYNIQL